MKKIISIILTVVSVASLFAVTAYADYENTYVNSGNYNEDIAGVALTQVGCDSDEFSKYGNNENSSLDLLYWCASEASVPGEVIPEKGSISELYEFFAENLRINANPDYVPSKGDILFIGSNSVAEECAIVISTDTQFVTAVIGDSDKTVKKKLYTIGMDKIVSYATPDYSFVSNYTEGKHMTTASFLNLRSEPNTDCDILAKLPIGTIVDITRFSGDWGYITYDGLSGWISMDYTVLYDDFYADTSEYSVTWNVIDVSRWQGDIDWNKVSSGDIEAVIMRIGLRGSATREVLMDERFLEYYNGAKNAGLHIGCYFYSTATNDAEAIEEAEFVIKSIKDYNLEFDMPVYIDMEDPVTEKCGKTEIFSMTYSFLEKMDESNIYSGVYCSTSWAEDYYNQTLFNTHALWIADWHDKCGYSGVYGMWQYTDKGGVSGVESRYTDLNICYINYPMFIYDNGFNTDKPVSDEKQKGDVDSNGKINAADARLALRISASLHTPSEDEKVAADVNGDGNVTASDARKILRISAMLE